MDGNDDRMEKKIFPCNDSKVTCDQNSDHKNVLLLKRLFTKITFKANNSILRSIKN